MHRLLLLFVAAAVATLTPPLPAATCLVGDACGPASAGSLLAEGWHTQASRFPVNASEAAGTPLAGHNGWFDVAFAQRYAPSDDACDGYTSIAGVALWFANVAPSHWYQTIDVCVWSKRADGDVGPALYCEAHLLADLRVQRDRSHEHINRVLFRTLVERPTTGFFVGYRIVGPYGNPGDTVLYTSRRNEGEGGWLQRSPRDGADAEDGEEPTEPYWQPYTDVLPDACDLHVHAYPIVGGCQPCDADVSHPAHAPDALGWNFGTADAPEWCPSEPAPARPWLNRDACGVCGGDGSTCDGSACPPMTGVKPSMDCVHTNATSGMCTLYWGYTNDCSEQIVVMPMPGMQHVRNHGVQPVNWVSVPSTDGALPPACFEPGCHKHAFTTVVPCAELAFTRWQVGTGDVLRQAWFDPHDPRDAAKECIVDCAGTLNGEHVEDQCGACLHPRDPLFNRACMDCTGVPNGAHRYDRCGVCDGDSTSCIEQGGECGPLSPDPALPCAPADPTVAHSAALPCVDGVCCATRCDGLCEACDVADYEGVCTRFSAGTDPRAECDDQRYCNGEERCPSALAEGAARVCSRGPHPVCDDSLTCTQDFCSDEEGHCFNVPLATVGDKCLAPGVNATTVVSGESVCDYGVIGCTDGELCCVQPLGPHFTEADEFPAYCDGLDNNCNGLVDEGCHDVCRPPLDRRGSYGWYDHNDYEELPCPESANPCIVNECQEVPSDDPYVRSLPAYRPGYRCVPVVQVGLACDDGLACTTGDVCSANAQCAGTPTVCTPAGNTDGRDAQCVTAACDPESGACLYTDVADGTGCSDGDACTTGDVCFNGYCDGTPVAVDDSNLCTDDSCVVRSGVAVVLNVPNKAPCDDGFACTVDDACEGGECVGTAKDCGDQNNECTACECAEPDGKCCCWSLEGQACNEANSVCAPGVCSDFECVVTPYDCDDSLVCTVDTCLPVQSAPGGPVAPQCRHVDVCVTTTTASASTVGASTTTVASASTSSAATTTGATTAAASASTSSVATTAGAATSTTAAASASTSTVAATTGAASSTTTAASASTSTVAATTGAASSTTGAASSTTTAASASTSTVAATTGAASSTTGAASSTTAAAATTVSSTSATTGPATATTVSSTSATAGQVTTATTAQATTATVATTASTTGVTSSTTTTAAASTAAQTTASATVAAGTTTAGGYSSQCTQDSQCTDGHFCNGLERCVEGFCTGAGVAPNCDDSDKCTDDACNHDTNQCTHIRNTQPGCGRRDAPVDLDGPNHVGHNHHQEVEGLKAKNHNDSDWDDDGDDWDDDDDDDEWSGWWIVFWAFLFIGFCVVAMFASDSWTPVAARSVRVHHHHYLEPPSHGDYDYRTMSRALRSN